MNVVLRKFFILCLIINGSALLFSCSKDGEGKETMIEEGLLQETVTENQGAEDGLTKDGDQKWGTMKENQKANQWSMDEYEVKERSETKQQPYMKGTSKDPYSNDPNRVIATKLDLYPEMEEEELITQMHLLTHQKVDVNGKIGGIHMTEESIEELYLFLKGELKNVSESRKKEMVKIATRWKEGSFDQVDQEHNHFLEMVGGDIGEAYSISSKETEERFILMNFSEAAIEANVEKGYYQ